MIRMPTRRKLWRISKQRACRMMTLVSSATITTIIVHVITTTTPVLVPGLEPPQVRRSVAQPACSLA